VPGRNRPRFIALTKRLNLTHPELEDPIAAIAAGDVKVDGVIATNPAARVPADASIRLRLRTKPRGQVKLAAAIEAFAVPVTGRIAADIGASTGGFTLALLAAGARRVYAIDAGHGQLLGSLRLDPRVTNLEGVNLGALNWALVPEAVEVITVDLSYLSLARAAPQLEALAITSDADLVALVKPMYELGLGAPPDDPADRAKAVELAVAGIERWGWQLVVAMESPVQGGRGAVEHLIHMERRRGNSRSPQTWPSCESRWLARWRPSTPRHRSSSGDRCSPDPTSRWSVDHRPR
jgi:23S rRNA (cytidine1920-2'-O)/16S rRNA (cytidine1409-2'-O)-methyltransferase